MTENDKNRTCKVCFRLKDCDRELLQDLANSAGMGISAYVRMIIETTLYTMRATDCRCVEVQINENEPFNIIDNL